MKIKRTAKRRRISGLALQAETAAGIKELNRKADAIIGIMRTPENRIVRILELIATIAGVISILGIADLIAKWLNS